MKQLIITEKPSVAMNICTALGIEDNGNNKGFIENDERILSWCFGHLIELAEPSSYGEQYKKWSIEALPIFPDHWNYEIKEESAEQFEILKTLMNRDDVGEIVEATDAGREGEAIFRLVYMNAECEKPFRRLWISSMEADAIRKGFDSLDPGSDYDDLYASAKCRMEADWLVGINGTRLFSTLYGKTFKVGRVQTPTLSMIVNREFDISNFKKEPYYTVHLSKDMIDAVSKPIKNKNEAENFLQKCNGKTAKVISVKKEEKTTAPPLLYDLTSLQRDANRIFGYTAKQTLDYTQSLYEKRLLTYPRTDSRYLSDDMEKTTKNVLYLARKKFLQLGEGEGNDDYSRILNSKKVSDHHAIIPTIEIASPDLKSVPGTEMNILTLVAVRLACAVSSPHRYMSMKAVLSCEGEEFSLGGKIITEKGWKEIDDRFRKSFETGEEEKENVFPDLKEGQVIDGMEAKIVEGTTKPPKHYSEDTLLAAMEKAGSGDMTDYVERKGLGTPATRADIIEKLVHDGFLKREKKQILPTEDGIKLISVMPDQLKSAKLTSEWENELARIAKGESDADSFMARIRGMVSVLISENKEVSDEQRAAFGSGDREILGKCPRCGSDVIKGKYGAYCSKKCGMKLGKAMGTDLTDDQIKTLLKGDQILVKDIKSKKGKTYDAYLTPKGISDFSYTDKDGQERTGFQFDYIMTFPEKKGEKC